MPGIPTTTWQDPNHEVEYTVASASNLVDQSGNQIVDQSANLIVDTGITAVPIPATPWSQDETQ